MDLTGTQLLSNYRQSKTNPFSYRKTKYVSYLSLSALMLSLSLFTDSSLICFFSLLSFVYIFSIPLKLPSQLLTYPLFFTIFLAFSSHWLIYCLLDFSGLNFFLSCCLLFFILTLFSLIMSAPCFLYQVMIKKFNFTYSLSFLLILFDYLRMHTFLAAPWLFYGVIPSSLSFFQLFYPLGGIFLTGYLCLRTFEVMVNVINGKIDKDGRFLIILFICCSFFSAFFYFSSLFNHQDSQTEKLKIKLIQPNYSHREHRDPYVDWQKTVHLLAVNQDQRKQISVLPEGILSLQSSQMPISELISSEFFNNTILGLNYISGENFTPMMIGTNRVHGRYTKHHLVPFGEYLPLSNILAPHIAFFNTHRTALSSKNFSLFNFYDFNLYPLICYDLFFPLANKNSLSDADALLAIAENTWYRDSLFQSMFIRASKIRALESKKPLLLAMNIGNSLHIDQHGVIQSKLPFNHQGSLSIDIAKSQSKVNQPYAMVSDGFIIVLLFVFESITIFYFHSMLSQNRQTNEEKSV